MTIVLSVAVIWRCNPAVTGSERRREARYSLKNANQKADTDKTKTDFSYVYVAVFNKIIGTGIRVVVIARV